MSIINAKLKTLPKYATSEFIPPQDLSADEKQVWDDITSLLKESRSSKVSDADYELIRQYCQITVARNRSWHEYKLKPERYTKIVTGICADGRTPKIVIKDNEHYKTWVECNKHLEVLIKELELDPKSRPRSRNSAAKVLENKGGW